MADHDLTDATNIELESATNEILSVDRTDEAAANRWQKYGHDRLYLEGPAKFDKNSTYLDLESGELEDAPSRKHSAEVTIDGETATVEIHKDGKGNVYTFELTVEGEAIQRGEDNDDDREVRTDGGEAPTDRARVVDELADMGEVDVDLQGGQHATSDSLSVETPAGRLEIDRPSDDDLSREHSEYGGPEHPEYQQHRGVWATAWPIDEYLVVLYEERAGSGDDYDTARCLEVSEVETGTEEPLEQWDARAYATGGDYTTFWNVRELPSGRKVEIQYQRGNGEIVEADGPRELCVDAEDVTAGEVIAELQNQAAKAVQHAREYFDEEAGVKKFDHGPASKRRVLPESCGWQARARDLHEHGGVPETRAKAIALVETDRGLQEAGDVLGMDRRNVHTHVERYRNQDLEPARWLAENGPDL